MESYAKNCKSTVIPGLAYRNALAMIDWLCDTFGFVKKAVYTNPDSTVAHSELTFGNGMIMIGSAASGSPVETHAPYLVVTDCDSIYAKAKAAGAKIVVELEEKPYGGKAFTCADPEGHIWHIGTYDPWSA